MSLIDAENDDAVLAAEDAAIMAAENPVEPPPLPMGDDLAELFSAADSLQIATFIHEAPEGHGRARR